MKKPIHHDPERKAQADMMRTQGYISVAEASGLARVPRATLYGWLRSGALEHKRVGLRKLYVSRAALARLAGLSFRPAA